MSTLLVEIGVEELPSGDVRRASEAFGTLLSEAIRGGGLGPGGEPEIFATPRRLAVRIGDVRTVRDRTVRRVRGPGRDRAYEADGSPTRALQGFLRGQHVSLDDVRLEETAQGVYVVVDVPEGGEPALELLGPILEQVLSAIPFARPMRWGEGEFRFGRPVVWLVALLDREVVPCSFAGVEAGRESLGHRFLHPGPVVLEEPADYEGRLRDAFVLADRGDRQLALRASLEAAAAAERLVGELSASLVEEVTDLVEWPTAFVGHVDPRFLALPDAALTTPMVHHQRQFPTRAADPGHERAAAFLAVRNGDDRRLDLVRQGNERVLAARLTDALFFYEKDQACDAEVHRARLSGTELGAGLGTLLERAERTERMVQRLLVALPDVPWAQTARTAAHLVFSDRTTLMVSEFPELTGEMAAVYAGLAGHDEAVVRAIRQAHEPRDADGSLPMDPAGRIVALAIRAEEVVGAFAAGRIPTGSEDPYGVRRAALGIVRIGLQDGIPGGLENLLAAAAESFAGTFPEHKQAQAQAQALDFIRERVEARLADQGIAPEVAQAVCSVDLDRLETVQARARGLTEALQGSLSDTLITAYRRAARLLVQAGQEEMHVDTGTGRAADGTEPALPVEIALERAVAGLERETAGDLAAHEPARYFAAVAGLAGPLDAFFQGVMVMDPDVSLRTRRLGLLARVTRVASLGADLSRLGRQRTEPTGPGRTSAASG